jgi:D-arabinose 1-dehydrogenase-like Zn-dependent alcohol dehydrogenase
MTLRSFQTILSGLTCKLAPIVFNLEASQKWEYPMRAIVIKQFGGLDSLAIENLPDPVPQPGSVLIEVKAFGTNHAETHMRKEEWAEVATVSGIECVGLVKSCPGAGHE